MPEMKQLHFVWYGKPQHKGSIRSFHHKTTGAIVSMSTNKKLKPYQKSLGQCAALEMQERNVSLVISDPVSIIADFVFTGPKKMPKDRRGMTVKPDLDKLLRALKDSLTGVVYKDDAQVTEVSMKKEYGLVEHVKVSITTL